MCATELKKELTAYANSLGFERVGVTSAARLEFEESYLKEWIAKGRAGQMQYMTKDPVRRARPAELLSGAKSVISLAMSYGTDRTEPTGQNSAQEGHLARYALGHDYHKTIRKRLDSFVRYLNACAPGSECRTFVDTGPLLERAVAQRAGLGFIGKNTMLISKGLGSWVFLASVITTLELQADAPDARSCGDCRLCIDACPTQAITEPFRLDPRRCIAYLTIEQEGPIPEELRPELGNWVFGCDICQEVCPHNARRAKQTPVIGLSDILLLNSEDEFEKLFQATAMKRAGYDGLLRNACVAAANLERHDLRARLEELAQNSTALVREHAAWAIEQLDAISSQKSASTRGPAISSPGEEAGVHH